MNRREFDEFQRRRRGIVSKARRKRDADRGAALEAGRLRLEMATIRMEAEAAMRRHGFDPHLYLIPKAWTAGVTNRLLGLPPKPKRSVTGKPVIKPKVWSGYPEQMVAKLVGLWSDLRQWLRGEGKSWTDLPHHISQWPHDYRMRALELTDPVLDFCARLEGQPTLWDVLLPPRPKKQGRSLCQRYQDARPGDPISRAPFLHSAARRGNKRLMWRAPRGSG